MARARSNPIPDDFKEYIGELSENEFYVEAWERAASKGNPPKACMVYADNHWQDHELAAKQKEEAAKK
jgi:hypothetical protein